MFNLSVSFEGIKKLTDYLKTFMAKQDRQLKETAEVIAKEIEILLLEPTKTWAHKPNVKTEVKKYALGYKVEVIIDDKPYFFVNFGTKPHPIKPINGKFLKFNFQVPKTVPGSLYSRNVVKRMGDYIYAKEVYHPGIQPRRFDKIARQQLTQKLPMIVQNKMHRFWQQFFRGIF